MLRIGLFILTNLAVMLVAGIVLSLLGVGRYINHGHMNLTNLLIYCAVFGFAGSFISLFISKFMAKHSMGVVLIDHAQTTDEQWLLSTVEELAKKAGIKMPEVGIFPAEESNAFATGWNRNAALVAVSTGLLNRFQRDEVRAVLAHEIGHVANGDMITLSLVQGVVNTFVMFFARIVGFIVDKALQGNNEERSGTGIGFYIATFVAEIIFGFLASMLVAAFSRYREYRADEAGANLADRNAMIRALQRLQVESGQGLESSMPASMQAFGISGGMGKLFASHPPLADRILALQNGRNNSEAFRSSIS